ncbi:hypothetical protein [uncultured Brevundimonas sp.]|uniref:hypothetical protein n=1 Tax=uncultured Brevundimonas sp. TaxID=213418 RepID=UPI002608E95E|nr:hypothetical protein [uncultured Brevundimonas sp.]
MIPEYKLYHGAVLADLVHELLVPVSIDELSGAGRLSSYVLNGRIGLQIKHSSQRLHPWSFTFTRQNFAELLTLRETYAQVYLVLVCHTDGMVCLTLDEVAALITVANSEQAWLRIDRRRGQWYTVNGSGSLPIKRPKGLAALVEDLNLMGGTRSQITADSRNVLAGGEG